MFRSAIEPALLETAKESAWKTVQEFDYAFKKTDDDLPYCLPLPIHDHTALLDHAEALLQGIGADPYWLQNLMLIMKRPHEGRRFWHTDCPPIFAPSEEFPPVLFVLYFLQKTIVKNGALLVVPGYADGPQHSDRVATPLAEEYPVEVNVGDVIVLDPRLLHGSTENDTDDYRFNIRLWIDTRWKG